MPSPLISVIVPVYCCADTLERCVQSVLAQDFADWELILVDDGSPDQSGALCDAFAARDSRITALHQKNGGASAARNAGLNAAQGTYIDFLDSDDLLAPGFFSAAVPLMENEGLDLFLFCLLRLSDGVQKVICPDIDICDAITRHMLVPGAQKEYIAQTNASAIVSAKRIAAKYNCHGAHSDAISEFACTLFDKLKNLHGMSRDKKIIL